MEAFESNISEILIQHLKSKGIASKIIERFIKDMIYAFSNNPEISLFELSSYLHQMGWDDVNIDYQTYQLAKASFEDREMKNSMPK